MTSFILIPFGKIAYRIVTLGEFAILLFFRIVIILIVFGRAHTHAKNANEDTQSKDTHKFCVHRGETTQ